jgi:RNA polymerase sigma-70 factor (ECF subfamily)
MESDYDLLDAWRGGDGKAGNQLFDRHFDSVYRFLQNKTDQDPADLVQRVFLACVERKDSFRGESSFRTYLFSIARNLLYRHYRDRNKHGVDFGVTSLQDLGPTPTFVVDKRAHDRLLLEALRCIPLELQIAIELHYWERLSGPELARVLELPEGTVRSRLRRAREALQAKLEELATSPAQLATTMANLENWANAVRDVAGHDDQSQ